MTQSKVNIICEEAIVAISKGDREALSVVYDSMSRMIFSVALAVTGSVADAEDVLQDTMIGIVRSAHTYQKGTNARAWILAMARNRAINMVNRRKHTVPLEEITDFPDPASREPSNHISALELLRPLSEKDRQIVLLRLYQELSFEEIAAAMGITLSAAQKRYQRAIHKLKKQYCKGGYGNEGTERTRTKNHIKPTGRSSSAAQGEDPGGV